MYLLFLRKMAKVRKKLIVALLYYGLLILVVNIFYNNLIRVSLTEKTFLIFLFLFVVPAWLVNKVFADKLTDYNFSSFKTWKRFLLFLSVVAVIGLSVLFFMVQWKWRVGEDIYIWRFKSLLFFWLETVFVLPISVWVQEFFFRGFLLKNFENNFNCLFSSFSVAVLTVFFAGLTRIIVLQGSVLLGVFLFNLFLSAVVCWRRSIVWSVIISWIGFLVIRFILLYQIGGQIIKNFQ